MNEKILVIIEDNSELKKKYIKHVPVKLMDSNRVKFVGFLITKTHIVMSKPKEYISRDFETDMSRIFDVIEKHSYTADYNLEGNEENFPIRAYNNILNYFLEKGLYFRSVEKHQSGFKGNINWKKTINKSNKNIVNNNIVFHPFYISKKEKEHVFLSETMDYILTDGYKTLKYFNKGYPYTPMYKEDNKFKNFQFTIKRLKEISTYHFKDDLLKLIDSCIHYFEWKSSAGEEVKFYVNDFSLIWQRIVHKLIEIEYLDQLLGIEISNDKEGRLLEWEKSMAIATECERKYDIFIDHFLRNGDMIYMLDSKYRKMTYNLDYKQIAYYYFIKSMTEFSNREIQSILVYPGSLENRRIVIIERTGSDGLYLIYVQLNINDAIINYLAES